MGRYIPYAGTNSIREAVIGINFPRSFPPEMIQHVYAEAAKDIDIKNVLPSGVEIQQTGEIRLGPVDQITARTRIPLPVGFRFVGGGRLALQLSGNILSLNIYRYEGWSTFLRQASKYFRTILSNLSLKENPATVFSLQYVDQFTFEQDTPGEESQADILFNKSNKHMTRTCFENGPYWHCYSGWFELVEEDIRILNQLNINSAIVDQIATATIIHSAIYQTSENPRRTTDEVFRPPSEKKGFEYVLNQLHEQNGLLLRSILLPDILKQIGLIS